MNMENKVLDAVWLNEAGSCTMVHLSEVSGLEPAELQVLVDSGALSPLPGHGDSLAFASSRCCWLAPHVGCAMTSN